MLRWIFVKFCHYFADYEGRVEILHFFSAFVSLNIHIYFDTIKYFFLPLKIIVFAILAYSDNIDTQMRLSRKHTFSRNRIVSQIVCRFDKYIIFTKHLCQMQIKGGRANQLKKNLCQFLMPMLCLFLLFRYRSWVYLHYLPLIHFINVYILLYIWIYYCVSNAYITVPIANRKTLCIKCWQNILHSKITEIDIHLKFS